MASIYQRTRPIHWDEVVGQEHVKDVLRPALERGRIGHAYLFSGPRGVGKTTTARLIAMTVNCDDNSGIVKPCGKCESCRMVMAGRHPDVLEIDAASNNSVDDVRDLREKVALQPMRGDKKVYILDEAHMMSKSAFNALLKTLEEPPSHAVFILATTEPERLPPTILSRCQHYRFRRLSVAEIAGKLQKTCDSEGVTAAPEALNLMARAADGAMRDGESLLERMLAAGEPVLTLQTVEGALGLPPQDRLQELAVALVRVNSSAVLEGLNALYADGFAPRTITERVKIALRDLLHAQLGVGGVRVGSTNLRGERDERFDESLLLKLIRALDEEDGRFARASDLLSLEMAFTKALVVAQGLDAGGAELGLMARVMKLEKQLQEGVKAAPAQLSRPSLPDFDPMARGAKKPVVEARAEPAPKAADPEIAPFDDDREPSPNRAFVQEFEARKPVLSAKPPVSAPKDGAVRDNVPQGGNGKTWGDVVTKAKAQLKAFLREASADLTSDTLTLTYTAKHKWHADQVASKLEELGTLTREVLGAHYALELVMPDGSKKNSRADELSTAATPPATRAPVSVAQTATAILNEIAVTQTPVETQQATDPDIPVPDPEPAPHSPRANPMGAPIETAPSQEPDELVFQQLGSQNPAESLFGAPVFVAVAAEPALEGEEVSQHSMLEPSTPVQLDPIPEPEETAPLPGRNLETYDLSAAPDAPPLEAFDLDFGDVSAPPKRRGETAPSSLTGHANYGALSKLFSHRVIGAGRFEAKVALPEAEVIAPGAAGIVAGLAEEAE